MPYLELQNLHRDFGTVKALDGIEIQLGEGEFLSLLGPSGCGKTTALRLVAGFDRPDAGRIVVDEPQRRRLAAAGRSEQREELALPQLDLDPVQRLDGAEI